MHENSMETLVDFVTGEVVPNTGAEANRQKVEKILVNRKGYEKKDIEVDVDIEIEVDGTLYRSQIDLVVTIEGIRFMAIKCAAGSLGSREREILAAARILDRYQIPFALVSDGNTAILLDAVSGKTKAEGLDAVPSKPEARKLIQTLTLHPFPRERLEREKLIFRSYDSMNVNVRRKIPAK